MLKLGDIVTVNLDEFNPTSRYKVIMLYPAGSLGIESITTKLTYFIPSSARDKVIHIKIDTSEYVDIWNLQINSEVPYKALKRYPIHSISPIPDDLDIFVVDYKYKTGSLNLKAKTGDCRLYIQKTFNQRG